MITIRKIVSEDFKAPFVCEECETSQTRGVMIGNSFDNAITLCEICVSVVAGRLLSHLAYEREQKNEQKRKGR